MSNNIQIKRKTNSGFVDVFPYNSGDNINRGENRVEYIEGNNAVEVIQNMANKYIEPSGENWKDCTNLLSNMRFNDDTVICGVRESVIALTPRENALLAIVYMNDAIKVFPMNIILNKVLCAEAVVNENGVIGVLLIGLENITDLEAVTYFITFKPNTSPVYFVFDDKIPLV